MNTIGERIETIRNTENFNVEEFLVAIGVTKTTYYGWKNGAYSPNSDIVVRILTKFNDYNPEWLLLGNGEMKKLPYQMVQESKELYEKAITKSQLQRIFTKMIDEINKL